MANVCVTSSDVEIEETVLKKMLTSIAFREPLIGDKIFKDECMYCFETPLHPGGLYVCMQTFAGLCEEHISEYCEKTSRKTFLHCKDEKIIGKKSEEPKDKVTKLAIGLEGGFNAESDTEVISNYSLIVYPQLQSKIKLQRLSGPLLHACAAIIKMDGAQRAERLETGVNVWDGEAKIITKHAELTQLENGVKIPLSGWKCDEGECGLMENLWLNLTDGAIKCGRSQFVKEGVISKGNNHMRNYFDKTGYPLVVKLGTITKDDADLFSYDEDECVRDPNLKKHLAHFGIDMKAMEKTEKSTLEMELDLNQKWEWAMCQEDGENLELAFGPGLTGMINIGSSCYINSAIQMLTQIPEFAKSYGGDCKQIFSQIDAIESHNVFNCQLAKVVSSLFSGKFSQRGSDLNCIKPVQFRRVVGKNHAEFSSARQQDAEEYIRHLLSMIDENYRGDSNPVDAIRFKMEHRLQDNASLRVSYESNEELVLSLDIPWKEEISNIKSRGPTDVPVRIMITLRDIIKNMFMRQSSSEFRSPVTGEDKGALHRYRMQTFPDYLIMQLKKFAVSDDWIVKKMDVNVEMPDEIDLSPIKGHGLAPNEELLPKLDDVVTVDETIVNDLIAMGFTPEASRRATLMTRNTGAQNATLWIMDHIADDDLNTEHPKLISKLENVDSSAVEQLTVLGFTPHQARYALQRVNGVVNAAADWLFVNSDSVPPECTQQQSKKEPIFRDGITRYRLVGFISHMGSTPHSGHYVTHLRKNDKWYLFNDEKVAVSRNPPTTLGYIYLYERVRPEVTKDVTNLKHCS